MKKIVYTNIRKKKINKIVKNKVCILMFSFLFASCSNTANQLEKSDIQLSEEVKSNIVDNKGSEEPLSNKIIDDIEMHVITDIHYISNKINDGGEAFQKMVENSDGRQINYIEEMVDAFVYETEQNKPEVLIISGDLTHHGEKDSHLDLAEKFEQIEENGTQVLVVPGNHDINNPYAREFKEDKQILTDSITADEFQEIYADFGYNNAFKRDKNSLSYLATPTDNVWVLMLDSSIYNKNVNSPATNGKIKDITLEWIKECAELAKENNAQIVTSMHHNLYKHSNLLYHGFVLDNADEVLEVFKEYNLNIVLSGHIHVQNIMSDETNTVFDIVTSGFVIYPLQYGILNFNNEGFTYNTELVDVEKWAKDFDIQNEDLLNFTESSKQYFYEDSYNKIYSNLLSTGKYTEAEAKDMAHIVSILNVNYFAGTVNDIRDEVINSNGYKLWLESEEDGFFKAYVVGMLEDSKNVANYLEIKN